MHSFPCTARNRVFVLLSLLVAICAGCQQLGRRADKATTEPSPTPLLGPTQAGDSQIPPVPASEARFRGFSPPKALLAPIGPTDEAIDTVDHAENSVRAGLSQGDDQTGAEDLTIPEGEIEIPVPPPQDIPEGPVAELDSSSAPISAEAEIDIAEFLAELDLVPPPSLKALPHASTPGPLPVIVPGRSPMMTPHGVMEDWPRQGLPWNVVVTPAMIPLVQKLPANRPLPASPRLAFENSSWADEPIE